MRWQMSLYKEMAGKAEDAEDPEKVVKRVQEVSAVLYHIEVVSGCLLRCTLFVPHLLSENHLECAICSNRCFLKNISDRAPFQIQENGLA